MSRIRTLGPKGTQLISYLSRQNINIFTIEEAVEILKNEKSTVKKLLHNLVGKGWLQKLTEGKYILIPLTVDPEKLFSEHQFINASKLIRPYYIGYWSMLSHYGYTEQLVNTVFIASTKQKKQLKITGVTYKFITIAEFKMFGIIEIKLNNNPILVSDKEKTIIDCLDHPEHSGGIIEITKAIWNARNEISPEKLLDYIKRTRNSAVAKRLGYIFESLDLKDNIFFENLRLLIRKGFSIFDPLLPKEGKYVTKWNLLVNLEKEDLLAWKTT